ncbi:MAG: hypothetical protein ACLFWL_08130 [Candidatus Brocadiia bacterium]
MEKINVYCALLILALVSQSVTFGGAPRRRAATDSDWADYIQKRRWREGKTHFKESIIDLCTQPNMPPYKKLQKLHYYYYICHFYPFMEDEILLKKDRDNLTKWLLNNPSFNKRFLMAIEPQDDPGRCFEIILQLLKNSMAKVETFPELAFAYAVVWDSRVNEDQEMIDSVNFYTKYARRMRFDLRKMPHQVSKYVIDSSRKMQERMWALKNYHRENDMGEVYKSIWLDKYDDDAYLKGKKKEISNHALTLPNIKKHGGVCREAAIFASEVGKACGIPSVFIRATTGRGEQHAWIGYLKREGGGYEWDCDTGRLSSEKVAVGKLTDPQIGEHVSEHHLDYALSALKYPEETRHKARVWCDTAQILHQEKHNPQAKAALFKSLRSCVYDNAQWETYTKIAKTGDFSTTELMTGIDKFCKELRHYPKLVASAFETLVTAIEPENTKARLMVYDHIAEKFPDEYEVRGRVRLLEGKYLESVRRNDKALSVYKKSAVGGRGAKDVMIPLLDNATRIMLDDRDIEAAIKLHEGLFERLPKSRKTISAMQTTWFAVGLRLAKLHLKNGNKGKHNDILKDILDRQTGSKGYLRNLTRRLLRMRYEDINHTRPPQPTGF